MAVSPLNYRHYLAVVVKQHPSVQSAQNQLESARQDVEGAKWQFYPTPSIGAEKSSKSANGISDSRTTYARMQQPLWTGGRLTAQLDKAQTQETIASLTLAEQRLTLAQRWLQLWAETQAAELKVQAFADSEEQHRKYVQQVQSRAQEGQAPRSDTQLSLTRLAAVQAELEQAHAQKRQTISRLKQLYGTALPVNAIRWTAALPAKSPLRRDQVAQPATGYPWCKTNTPACKKLLLSHAPFKQILISAKPKNTPSSTSEVKSPTATSAKPRGKFTSA